MLFAVCLLSVCLQNRLKTLLPRVIRPDLVLGDDGKLTACELDAVPGGIGFTGSMVCPDVAGVLLSCPCFPQPACVSLCVPVCPHVAGL